MLQYKISPLKDIGQQEVESKPHNCFANLHTMCKTNIRIWDCCYHNCFGIHHQQNTKSLELFYQASASSPKVCVSSLIKWHLATSICQRKTHSSRPKPLNYYACKSTSCCLAVYGPDRRFQDQWLDVERCYLTFLHLLVGVSRSVWWFKYGN